MIDVLTDLIANHIPENRTVVCCSLHRRCAVPATYVKHWRFIVTAALIWLFLAVQIDRSVLKAGIMVDGNYQPINRPEYVFFEQAILAACV